MMIKIYNIIVFYKCHKNNHNYEQYFKKILNNFLLNK